MIEQWADLQSHHIEGIAVMSGSHFSVPLISHITGNLWTGGCIDGVRLPDEFRYVVSLYPWEKYRLGPDTERLEVALYDSADLPDEKQLREVAEQVNTWLERGQTLVHCQAGLNRSGLVAGLALVLAGWEPVAAITELRSKRSAAVLCNGAFEQWLCAQGGGES